MEEARKRSPVGRRIPNKTDNEDDSIWGGVVFVDPASARMIQAGPERWKIPRTISSTWDYYRRIHQALILQAAVHGAPPGLIIAGRYVNQTRRRLRELVSVATTERARS